MFQDCKFVGEVDSGSESFPDLRGNEDFNAGYNVSCVVVVVVFLLLIVVFLQAGYVDAENDCRCRQSGEFHAGSLFTDGGKVYKWRRDLFKGSRYEERK